MEIELEEILEEFYAVVLDLRVRRFVNNASDGDLF